MAPYPINTEGLSCMKPCPCGSKVDYLGCCGQYIDYSTHPKTPEALMRSRFTAYSLADIAYIKKNHERKTRSRI